PSDDIVEVRAQPIVAFLGRVAGPARVVKCQLPRFGVGALTRRLLGDGRETQKHQECGADQSRDCGAGHNCSWRLNARCFMEARSQAGPHVTTVASERRFASKQKLRADVADGSKSVI